MQELPSFIMTAAETVAGLKTHQLAYAGRRILYGSFVGSANACKVLRGAIRHGAKCNFEGFHSCLEFARCKGDSPFTFRQCGVGKGYVHAVIEPVNLEAFMVYTDADDEWHRELMRVSTVPIMPEWVPWLKQRIRVDYTPVDITAFNCDMQVYRIGDDEVSSLLKLGGEKRYIEIPECEIELSTLSTLPDYIRAYAQKMVESAGSSLRPLLDPKHETVSLPRLKRTPFVPQAWLIDAARRAMV